MLQNTHGCCNFYKIYFRCNALSMQKVNPRGTPQAYAQALNENNSHPPG